jgi:hypothetical protein
MKYIPDVSRHLPCGWSCTVGCYSKNCRIHPSATGTCMWDESKEMLIQDVIKTWNTR